MPMNLDSVGAVSDPVRNVVDVEGRAALRARRRRRPDRPDRVRARVHDRELAEHRAAGAADDAGRHLGWAAVPGLPSWGEFDFRMLLHGEQGVTVHGPIPRRRRGRVDHARSSASTTRARPRSCGSRTKSTYVDSGKPAFDDALRRVHPRRGRLRRDPRRRDRRPAEDARPQAPTTRSRTRRAPTRRCSTACRGDRNPLHSDPTIAKFAGFDRADPARALHVRLHRPRAAARAVRLRRRASSRAWTRGSRSRSCPATRSPCSMWDDGTGPRALPDRHPGRHRRHRRRRLHQH